MPALHTLKLLGGASIEGPAGPVTGPSTQRHRLALLALLASTPRGMSRDKLVALLWPERDALRARHALSDSVYRINKAFEDEVVVAAGDRDLWLDTDALPCDLADFRHALEREDWERAADLYEGPFLDGFHLSESAPFGRWADEERQRVDRRYARALESLAEERAERDDPRGAATVWRRRATLDRFDSRVARRLMEALVAEGNPAGALEHASLHTELLEREFGTGPDPDVIALAERIRTGPGARPRAASRIGPSTRGEGADEARSPTGITSPSPPIPAGPGIEGEAEGAHLASVRRWRRVGLVAAGALALVVAGIWIPDGASPFFDSPSGEPSAMEPPAQGATAEEATPSIAVLGFEDLSPEGDREWFADGIAEETVHVLAEVPGLSVISRHSSFLFRDRPLDLRWIADTLDVGYLVDGSVRMGGDSVWISAHLVDGATGFHLWSDTYATSLSSERLRSIQTRIARDVATTLSLRVGDAEASSADVVSDSSYQAYFEGRFHLRRFQSGASSDPREILRSLEYFRWVVEREPEWADGWASLGEAHHWAAYRGFEPERHRVESKRALERAVLLDPDHARANASLGYILHRLDRDYEEAAARFRHALELDSEQYWHCGYSLFLLWSERYEEAVDATRRAEGYDPMFLPGTAIRASSNRCAGRFEDAAQLAERVLSVDPWRGGARRDLALALQRLGRPDEALDKLEDADEPGAYLDLVRVLVLARSGRVDEAESLLGRTDVDRATQWAANEYSSRRVTAGPLHAAALVALGRREAAIEVLQRAVDRDAGTLLYDRCYPELRSLEEDPHYRELLRRTGVQGW